MFSLKLVFVISMLSVSVRNVRADYSEDQPKINAAVMPYMAECNKEFGVTEDDIKAAKKSGTLDALETCFIGCIFKKIKLINDQGLFDVDRAEELTKQYLSEEADQKKAFEVITTCKAVNERDVTDGEKGCDRAGFLLKCVTPFKDSFIH